MWFQRKHAVLGLEVPTKPFAPIGEVRGAYARQVTGPIAFEGPFPLLNDKDQYLCKGCGVVFDSWNLASALAALRDSLLDQTANVAMFLVNCRKCSYYSVFSPKDVVTGHQGDPTGPWSVQEIGVATLSLTALFRLSPAEISAIPAAHLHKVFFLYR